MQLDVGGLGEVAPLRDFARDQGANLGGAAADRLDAVVQARGYFGRVGRLGGRGRELGDDLRRRSGGAIMPIQRLPS